MSFQICALAKEPFADLFTASDETLASRLAMRIIATKKPGFPCRVSLQDAEIGEEVVLVHYRHQPANTPFQASHGIYIRAKARQAGFAANEIPEMLRSRIISLRGFDQTGMMVAADLADGKDLEPVIENLLSDPQIAYVHLHFAKAGCYAARIERALRSSQGQLATQENQR
jgi:hypothetical protein